MTAKKLLTLTIACLLTLSLAACGAKTAYLDDVSVSSISDTVLAIIPAEGGYDMSDTDFLTYYFEGNSAIDDFAIAASSISSDVNEYGILHVNDPAQVEEIKTMAEVYLSNQRDFLSTFLNTYNAAEMAKLDQGEVRVFGNYVVYTMLSEADTQAVMSAIEEMLKK